MAAPQSVPGILTLPGQDLHAMQIQSGYHLRDGVNTMEAGGYAIDDSDILDRAVDSLRKGEEAASMAEEPAASGVVWFGDFEADLGTEELRRNGMPVRMPSQSFQVLRLLVSRPGQLVARQQLQQALWVAESFGDFEHGLNKAVNRLREALGDSAENPRFIETLSRRGYRFIAPVQGTPSEASGQATELPSTVTSSSVQFDAPILIAGNSGTKDDPGHILRLEPRRRVGLIWLLLVLVICVAAAFSTYLLLRRHRAAGPAEARPGAVRVTPLTTLPGSEFAPAFSPDGSQVAFSWDGGKADDASRYDLYVKVVGSERLERLTSRPAAWLVSAWSPDGSSIAFARKGEGISGVFLISALGGPERKLAENVVSYTLPMSLSWSPDGKQLLYADDDGMHEVEVRNGAERSIAGSPHCELALAPTYSHDGRWITFSCAEDNSSSIYVRSQEANTQKKVADVEDIPLPLAWSTDDTRILYSQNGQLFEVAREGGASRLLSFAHNAWQPALPPKGERLAYSEWNRNVNLWQMNLGPSAHGSTRLLAETSREQRAPDISPDGKKLAFESERSGSHEVWVSNRDGSDAVQLSNFHSLSGTPRWSPDGRRIVFDSRESGQAGLYLVDPQTAVPRRIATAALAAQVPSWSRDGNWIYFHGGATFYGGMGPKAGLYKVQPAGGTPLLVSSTAGYNAQEAKRGSSLYIMSSNADAAIRVMDPATGSEHTLRGMPMVHAPTDWVVGAAGIYFVDATSRPATISFFDFATARVTKHMPLPKPPEFWGGLALSPDESWLTYAQVDRNESDLMMVDGFR